MNFYKVYTTPGEYIDALIKQHINQLIKYAGVLTYSDNPQNYWTGFFISRQSAKKFIRDVQLNFIFSSSLSLNNII